MNQTNQLLNALKKSLRAKGLTYRDVAAALELSEASVKRIFAEQTFSVARLEEVCRFLDMTIYDLARLARTGADEEARSALSMEQEQALADDPALLTYFYLLLTGRTPATIERDYDVGGSRHTRLLARLDRLKLIDLYPRNRIRLRTARQIAWRPDGPVRRLYEREVKAAFVRPRFTGNDELLRFDTGELSDASIKVLQRKIERLSREFDELVELDISLPRTRKQGYGMMLALRPWLFWQILERHATNR